MIYASEAAECGLACLAMIANAHGHSTDLNGLRERYAISMAGATLRNLIEIAAQLQLNGRAIRVELGDLTNLATPAILHWNFSHFVVLAKADSKGITIHDPASGVRRLSYDEADRCFTGVAVEFQRAVQFEPIQMRSPMAFAGLWGRSRGVRSTIIQILVLTAILQLVVFAAPLQLQTAIDSAVSGGGAELLVVIAGAFAGLALIKVLIEATRDWVVQRIAELINHQILTSLIGHLLRIRISALEKRHVGDILSRLSSARSIQEIILQGFVASILDGVMALGLIAVMAAYSWVLCAIVLAFTVIAVIVQLSVLRPLRDRQERKIFETASEQTVLMETVRAAATFKLMGREPERVSLWSNAFAKVVNASLAVHRLRIGLNASQGLVAALQLTAVIYAGSRMLLDPDGLTVGMLAAFLAYQQMFSQRALILCQQLGQYALLRLHLDRLADLVKAETDSGDGFAAPVAKGQAITFEAVAFKYGVGDRQIIEHLDLKIEPGEFLAITGPSGGGKTTLMKLALGALEPTSGRISIGLLEATPSVWRGWRKRVSVVAQDDRLLSGSIAQNIAFFDAEMEMTRVVAAAKFAALEDDINRMPMQYHTLVGDMGSALSGGQRQRLLLARAMYRRPDVLFLDEGTANLDVETEETIADALAGLPITRIVVAHRPALLARADRVIRVVGGRIVEITTREGSREPALQTD
jgi:ATP-binding cassette subfamily B protein RaxB